MNTVYLIGNGFDVNIGLPTRYVDFYNHYLALDRTHDSALVSKMKDHLQESLSMEDKYWSDLEEAMGTYTIELNTYSELEAIGDDLYEKMQRYIDSIEKTELPKGVNADILKKNLSTPESFLTPAEREIINSIYGNVSKDHHRISIVNFNYTTTIEKILKFSNKPLDIAPAVYHSGSMTKVENIYHIHGDFEQPILGINDPSQILNEKLRQNTDVQEYLVKPRINSILGHLIDRKARNSIEKANLICIYGLSLGKTDSHWWEIVGSRLLAGVTVILFAYDKDFKNIFPRKLGKYKREWRKRLCDAAKIPENKRDTVVNRLIVAPNTPVFDIINND